jgi:hypothetical protein
MQAGRIMAFEIGQQVEWLKTVNHDGHIDVIPVTIRKIGKTRITVEAPLNGGGTKLVAVLPYNLRPLRSGPQPD